MHEHSLTPRHKKGTCEDPKTQVEGGGTESDKQSEKLPPSNPQLHRNSRMPNATLEHLLLAAEEEARNLQNFFPLLHLPKEGGVLEPTKDVDEEPFPADYLEDWGTGVFTELRQSKRL